MLDDSAGDEVGETVGVGTGTIVSAADSSPGKQQEHVREPVSAWITSRRVGLVNSEHMLSIDPVN